MAILRGFLQSVKKGVPSCKKVGLNFLGKKRAILEVDLEVKVVMIKEVMSQNKTTGCTNNIKRT